MKTFLLNMLSNRDGELSSKRVIGFLGFLVLVATMLISAFSIRTIAPSPELVDAVSYITIAALFGNTVEKFSKQPKNSTEE